MLWCLAELSLVFPCKLSLPPLYYSYLHQTPPQPQIFPTTTLNPSQPFLLTNNTPFHLPPLFYYHTPTISSPQRFLPSPPLWINPSLPISPHQCFLIFPKTKHRLFLPTKLPTTTTKITTSHLCYHKPPLLPPSPSPTIVSHLHLSIFPSTTTTAIPGPIAVPKYPLPFPVSHRMNDHLEGSHVSPSLPPRVLSLSLSSLNSTDVSEGQTLFIVHLHTSLQVIIYKKKRSAFFLRRCDERERERTRNKSLNTYNNWLHMGKKIEQMEKK